VNNRLLFLVGGYGLGNSTRCDAVIGRLVELGYEVDAVTSANSADYFRASKNVRRRFVEEPLGYGKSGGRLSLGRTILQIPATIGRILKNSLALRRLLNSRRYRAVVVDSSYSILGAMGTDVVRIAINNSRTTVRRFAALKNAPAGLKGHFLIERLDFLFHRLFYDFVLSIELDGVGDENSQFISIPPIARERAVRAPSESAIPRAVLVLLGGSEMSSAPETIPDGAWPPQIRTIRARSYAAPRDPRVALYTEAENTLDLIEQSDLLVIQGGLSSISEAVVYKRPALVLPLESHAEQYVNAMILEEKGLGLVADRENFFEKLGRLIDAYPSLRRAHADSGVENGALIAARHIDRLARAR
jgi:UDP:flavonoid glycosyltransferase YjiC (YdhE family)